jgi:Permeases of the drug/metabolite transporter (DMT) superfamily
MSVKSPDIHAHIALDPGEVIEIINEEEIRNYKIGVIFIVIAVSTWVIGLELVNSVLKGDNYSKPFMFSVVTGSCFSLNYLPEVYQGIRSVLGRNVEDSNETEPVEGTSESLEKLFDEVETLSRKEIMTVAFQIALIYYLYNVFTMSALQFTSASNETVLGSLTSVFTLFISAVLKLDKFTMKKALCVAVSIFGVFMVNTSESTKENNSGNKFQPKNPTLGNALALCAALLYTSYLLVMKIRCGGAKTTNERQLFGLVGVFTIILGIPVLFLADYFGIEEFEFPPPSNRILFLILINGVFSVISDFSTIMAMLLTSPLVTSLSLSSAIPITICIDFIIIYFTEDDPTSNSKSFLYFLGIASILLSVVLINVNITSENEFIEEVIEEALEEAIREDEVFSPIFSPMLEPGSGNLLSPSLLGAKTPLHYQIGIKGSDILAKFSPHVRSSLAPLSRATSDFNLNVTSNEEEAPLFNPNHSKKFYTIDSSVSNVDSERSGIVVFTGGNHRYHLKNLDLPNYLPVTRPQE